jgi:alpha-glucoside transport system substrate-binding protein
MAMPDRGAHSQPLRTSRTFGVLALLASLLFACSSAPPAVPHVSVAAVWTGSEREAFLQVIDAFTAKTHISVTYESMPRTDMGAILRTRIPQGLAPDVVLNPRPGEVAEFARARDLVDLGQFISPDLLQKSYSQVYIDLGKVDGKQVGIFFKANSKSTFWYRPSAFKELNIDPPRTLEQLFITAERFKVNGQAPFSIGGKDGWVLTDYQENLLARLVDSGTYNKLYLTHEIPWTHPKVVESLHLFGRFFETGYQSEAAVNTDFLASIKDVFGPNPQSAMLYEGGFVGMIAMNDVNRNLQAERDIDFFPFPQVDARMGNPVVGGGDLATMFNDRPEVRSFMQFLISKEAADILASTNTISPNRQTDRSRFTSVLARKEFEQLGNAAVFVFDGSDMAPSALGGDYEFAALQKLAQYPEDAVKIAGELEAFAKSAY